MNGYLRVFVAEDHWTPIKREVINASIKDLMLHLLDFKIGPVYNLEDRTINYMPSKMVDEIDIDKIMDIEGVEKVEYEFF